MNTEDLYRGVRIIESIENYANIEVDDEYQVESDDILGDTHFYSDRVIFEYPQFLK